MRCNFTFDRTIFTNFFNQFSYFLTGSDQRLITACWELWDVKSVPCPLLGSGSGSYSHAHDQRRSQRRKFTSALTSKDVFSFFFTFTWYCLFSRIYVVLAFMSLVETKVCDIQMKARAESFMSCCSLCCIRWFDLFSGWKPSVSVPFQLKGFEQFFHVVLFVFRQFNSRILERDTAQHESLQLT